MSQSIKGFLKPTYYVLEEDTQLKVSVQKISAQNQKGSLNGHALAIAHAIHSIALAILINVPYYFALGSKNLFLNCVCLNLKHMVLGHYKAAMQNLIYTVIATIYVAIGTFIPPVLHGFKMEESKPDDPSSSDSSILNVENQAESKEPETRSPRPSLTELSLASVSFTQSEPSATSNAHNLQDHILTNLNCSFRRNSLCDTKYQNELKLEELPTDSSSGMSSIESQIETRNPNSNEPPYSFSLTEVPSLQNHVEEESFGTFSGFDTSLDSSVQNTNQLNSTPRLSSIEAHRSLSPEVSGDWLEIPDVESFAIKSTNIRARDMIGAYGVNLERQAYRSALNEYIRILKDDFEIDVEERLATMKNWLEDPAYQKNPMIKTLYYTLLYLTRPVAYSYTHAKEQYKKYVTSLRDVIVTDQYQSIRKDSNLVGEFKECLTLIRVLCEARFRSENHGLLRSLLQLHEDEYDRLHPEREEIPAVTRENFAQVVMAKNKKVTEAPASMKVSSIQKICRMLQGAIGYEDFLMTDIPFLRGKQVFKNDKGEERSFYYMRHPTPHVEGSTTWIALGAISRATGWGHIESGEAIAPEFEGMLEAIAERKESYLIQSHQRLNDIGKIENEDSRSKTLYGLQASHKNFHVVFQAVEGDLFNREDSYKKIETFAGLKEAIKASFYTEGSPNRLPAYLEKNEEYRNVIIDQLLDQVHQTLFRGRINISFDGQDPTKPGIDYPNHEWQAFILAFYILQGDDLKFRLPNVKYFCTNCKNFFDRGGNRAMAEDRLHQEMSEREVTSKDLEATIVNLIPVPLQSKGKAVIEKRLKPGLALVEILATLSLEDKRFLQEVNFEGYKPERFEVSKKEQRAVPLIEDVCTLQEMQEVLRALFETAQNKKEFYLLKDNEMVQNNWVVYQEKSRDHLFHQVNSDLKRFRVHVDGALYNGQESRDARAVFNHLTKCGISEDLALKGMAQMQQGVLFDSLNGLTNAFQHDKLGLGVMDTSKDIAFDVTTTGDSIQIKVQNSLFYKTVDSEKTYFRENPIAVFNTTVLLTIPKDGSASSGHWTWEIAEIPV